MRHAWGHKLPRFRLELPFCLFSILWSGSKNIDSQRTKGTFFVIEFFLLQQESNNQGSNILGWALPVCDCHLRVVGICYAVFQIETVNYKAQSHESDSPNYV